MSEELHPITDQIETELSKKLFHLKTLYDVSRELIGLDSIEAIMHVFLMMSTGPPFSVATTGRPLAAASSRVRPKGSVRAGLMKTPPLAAVILVVLILRSFLFEPFKIPSGSMMPTLLVGDFIVVNKYAYGLRLPVTDTKILDVGEPQRGDVVRAETPAREHSQGYQNLKCNRYEPEINNVVADIHE